MKNGIVSLGNQLDYLEEETINDICQLLKRVKVEHGVLEHYSVEIEFVVDYDFSNVKFKGDLNVGTNDVCLDADVPFQRWDNRILLLDAVETCSVRTGWTHCNPNSNEIRCNCCRDPLKAYVSERKFTSGTLHATCTWCMLIKPLRHTSIVIIN